MVNGAFSGQDSGQDVGQNGGQFGGGQPQGPDTSFGHESPPPARSIWARRIACPGSKAPTMSIRTTKAPTMAA
jgi:hypothetical protein